MKVRNNIIAALIVSMVILSALSSCTPKQQDTIPQQQAATPTQHATIAPPAETSLPESTSTPIPTQTPIPTATSKPVEVGASRSNPLPLGTEFKSKNWSIIVSDVIRGKEAAQAISTANMFNEPAKQGSEYLIANIKIKNISDKQEAQSASFAVNLRVTGDKNIVYSNASVVPPKSFEGELFPNGEAEGQEVFEVPSDEKNLLFIVNEMMSFEPNTDRYLAIDEDAKVIPASSLKDIISTDLGTLRDNPAKIGDTLVAGGLEFKVVEVVRGDKAAEMAKKANQFNDSAPDGEEYIAIKIKARFLGGDEPDSAANIDGSYLKITGEKNVVYESPSVVPPNPPLDANLFAGGETEGWEVLSVSKDEKGLVLIFQPLFSFSKEAIRYISIE
jgi:hypothetical protein